MPPEVLIELNQHPPVVSYDPWAARIILMGLAVPLIALWGLSLWEAYKGEGGKDGR